MAQKISDAIKPIYDKYLGEVHFMILPSNIEVNQITEKDLNNLGYFKKEAEPPCLP